MMVDRFVSGRGVASWKVVPDTRPKWSGTKFGWWWRWRMRLAQLSGSIRSPSGMKRLNAAAVSLRLRWLELTVWTAKPIAKPLFSVLTGRLNIFKHFAGLSMRARRLGREPQLAFQLGVSAFCYPSFKLRPKGKYSPEKHESPAAKTSHVTTGSTGVWIGFKKCSVRDKAGCHTIKSQQT